jgi:bifunctional UDP-N-acetylglucosamine pyrophosphorylase/glucosamine-1-phosphate N-acetyltransferase
MEGFEGNKTLLPLIPKGSPYEGSRPILLEILNHLPPGPKGVVVNYQKQEVIQATRGLGISYCEQPELNGTGGALLAARPFLERQDCEALLITMGDVPFVKASTYAALIKELEAKSLVVLGFRPRAKQQYGVLEIQGNEVQKITEWKYWKNYSIGQQQGLQICNAGIYAARLEAFLHYLAILAQRPHRVQKTVNGKPMEVEEYFLTDVVEYMHTDGLKVGYVVSLDEIEVMGIDDIHALKKAQKIFPTLNP